MSKGTFFKLFCTLESKCRFQGSKGSTTMKILRLFLDTLGWDNNNRDSPQKYQYSIGVIIWYFHNVLSKVLSIAHDIIALVDPNFTDTPYGICEDARFSN